MKKLKFDELGLSEKILRAAADMGFEEASPIQSETIPLMMAGRDVIGQAQTGTGKTAAFAIPIIERIDHETKALQALVMCPTRELVVQVTEEFRKLFKYHYNIAVVPVYGGQEIERQISALRNKPQIVVGTPGRLMDHMRRATIKLGTLRFVVLDEADEMLDMGFRDDMEYILSRTPAERQTVMFSATMPPDIVRLMKNYQKDPAQVDVTCHKVNAPKIEQIYYEVNDRHKPEALARTIDLYNIKSALVFCNTKLRVDSLVDILKNRGYSAEGIHGDLSQTQRERAMNAFKKGQVEMLVATDVAGRGIDVVGVEAVFNYDLPRDDEDYIHRIGRTGRAGKTGRAFTFVFGRQLHDLRRIEGMIGSRIVCHRVPSAEDVDESRLYAFSEKIREVLREGGLGRYMTMVENVIGDEFTAIDVAAALLKMNYGARAENAPGKSDEERKIERMKERDDDRGARPKTGKYSNNRRRGGRRKF